ncbi:DNA-binding transcriptional LysR family regulator [Duganella sp. 1411]|uniref:LysR family transcriptional regulator n=1 Tax=Duganella sp. 1411 TaxID=2806572 RepID=UPI001AE9C1E1|nr:LysR family transcriptional regulator [Duganella sp. 1411]MBP1202371.1 DNA-binding transcriptional LysR family regulator [Duganella sp. 1411]
MEDLNDLVLFAAVVTHGGFSGAARALGISKSRVSRRVAELEERLAVRLLQRSTRSVNVTEVGAAFFTHCESIGAAARAAYEVAERANARPSGRLRVSCPIGVAHLFLAPLLPKFMLENADVRLELDLTNRRVDVIGEGYDLAIRIRSTLEDSELVVRNFGVSDQVLVATPAFLQGLGTVITAESLQGVKGIGPAGVRSERPRWRLTPPDGVEVEIKYTPTFASDDVYLMSRMALAGVGVAQLPFHVCEEDIRYGRLTVLLPDHTLPGHQLHAVYPTRRGLVPAVKAFVEMLAAELPQTMKQANLDFQVTVARSR